MTTVVNKVKDRSKYMCKTPDGYAYGWMAYNRRDRSKDYFNKVGEGSLTEAMEWMASVSYVPKVHRELAKGQN